MANKRKTMSQEEIPDLVNQVLPVWQKEIDRMQALEEPTKDDIKLSIQLVQVMTQTYMTYRVLKAEVKKEIQQLSPDRVREIVKQHAEAKSNN